MSYWFNDVPTDWKVIKLKNIFKLINGGTPKSDVKEYWSDSEVIWITPEDLSKEDKYLDNSKRKISKLGLESCSASFIKANSLILSTRAPIGNIKISTVPFTTNQGCKSLEVKKKLNINYYYYVLLIAKEHLNTLGQGTTFLELSNYNLKNVVVPYPKIEIQNKISFYLDTKCEDIDELIEYKKKQIKLLEQQRQSIITEAVTKGLNPNVKMKDSGVEWIGEIPEHWGIKKVKHFATHVGSGKTPSGGSEVYLDEGVPFLRSLNVHFDGIRLKDLVFISEETNSEMRHSQVKPLDILLNITGASIGRTALVPKDFGRANVNQHVCIIRLNQNKVYPYYFNIIMSSDVINQQIWFAQNGSSREGLNFVQVKELTFAIPPTIEEQREINEWIFNKQKGIFEVIASIKEQISKLKEYRQSLIYEAVTGKIDVRNMELD